MLMVYPPNFVARGRYGRSKGDEQTKCQNAPSVAARKSPRRRDRAGRQFPGLAGATLAQPRLRLRASAQRFDRRD